MRKKGRRIKLGGRVSRLEAAARTALAAALRTVDAHASMQFNVYTRVGGRRMFPDIRATMHNHAGECVTFIVEVDGAPHYTHVRRLRGRGPPRAASVFLRQVERDDMLMQAVLDGDVPPVRMLFRVPETAKRDFVFWSKYIAHTVYASRLSDTRKVFLLDYKSSFQRLADAQTHLRTSSEMIAYEPGDAAADVRIIGESLPIQGIQDGDTSVSA